MARPDPSFTGAPSGAAVWVLLESNTQENPRPFTGSRDYVGRCGGRDFL